MIRHCANCFREVEEEFEVCPYCGFVKGTPPKEDFHLWPGVTLAQGRYQIGTVIGFGGFGITYKAWDTQLAQRVAIKEFYPAGLVNRIPGRQEVLILPGEKAQNFANELKRFLDEARNMAKFLDEPYIVDVHNYFEKNHTAYIVMEYLDGVYLKEYLKKRGGTISFEDALLILEPVMKALEAMHAKGLLHRDVSPDNIFITADDRVKLLDFGAARLSREDVDLTRSIIVKPGYTPPEQYRSKSRQGPWTDVYALGATMYRCITGELPEESIDRKVQDALKSPKKLGVKLPEYADRAIMKALALKAGLRFEKMAAFRQAMHNQKAVDYPEVELKKRRRRRLCALVASLVLLIGAGAAAWGYEQRYNVEIAPTDIVVWVPAASEDDADFLALQKIATEYEASSPGMKVLLQAVEPQQYAEALRQAAAQGEMPDMFRTDVGGEDVSDLCFSLDYLRHTMETDPYLLLPQYKKYYPDQLAMPTGFCLPALYWNESRVELSPDGPLDAQTVGELAQRYDVCVDAALAPHLAPEWQALPQDAQAAPLFLQEKADIYLGTVLDYRDVQNAFQGYYQLALLQSGSFTVRFENAWGVSAASESNRRYAAMKFIGFLLSSYAQNVLYVENSGALPLHTESLALYMDVNYEWLMEQDYLRALAAPQP